MLDKITLCRAKELNSNEWIYGYYCKIGPVDNQCDYIIPDYASALYAIPIKSETLGRFTGKYDVNNRMIFEGDIIHNYTDYDNYCSVVKWDVDSFAFIIQDDEDTLWLCDINRCEVLDNIYDMNMSLSDAINECNKRLYDMRKYDFSEVKLIKD